MAHTVLAALGARFRGRDAETGGVPNVKLALAIDSPRAKFFGKPAPNLWSDRGYSCGRSRRARTMGEDVGYRARCFPGRSVCGSKTQAEGELTGVPALAIL